MCRWEGDEGGGGARSLKGARREGEIPRDLAPGCEIPSRYLEPGERDHGGGGGGRIPWDTGLKKVIES